MNSALRIVYICLFIKLVLAAALPFFFDEAYYWFWGRNLQLSFFDHPPMVSFLFYIGQLFDSFGQASRWPGVFLSQFTIIIWLYILKDKVSEKKLNWFAIIMSCWPLFGLSAVFVTPDVPLLFFWSLSLLLFEKSLNQPSYKNYILFGLALGFGGLSKYQIALFIPCILIYLFADKAWKKVHWKKSPLIILFGLLACSPVLIWNSMNSWDSILFQLDHGLGEKNWSIKWTIDYALAQLLMIFPSLLWFSLKGFKSNKILHSFAWFPILFFLYSSTRGHVEANWPVMAYPSIAALAIINTKSYKWVKWTSAIWLSLSVVFFSNAFHYWLPIDINKTKFGEFKAYSSYKKVAESYRPLYGSSFQNSSYLSYLTKTEICKLRGFGRKDFFDYLDCSIPKEKRYYFLVDRNFVDLPDWAKDHRVIQRIPLDLNYQIVELEQP